MGRGLRAGRLTGLLVIRVLLALAVMAAGLLGATQTVTGLARAQIAAGATLTVLRGSVGVLRADGTPVSPAGSGLALAEGDQIATIGRGAALVTFFEGSEVELGADTTIVLRDLARQGQDTTITIESVLGTTVHRVVALSSPGSSYRIEAGGSVAVVRGTVFAHHVDPAGDVTLAVGEGTVDFPRSNMPIRRGEKRTSTSRGDIVDSKFDAGGSLYNAVTEATTSGNPTGTDNPGIGTGSYTAPQQGSQNQQREQQERDTPQQSQAGKTFLIAAAPSGTVRLEVASTAGFAIGDVIQIGTPPASETGIIVGFGSIIVSQPLTGSYGTGTGVEVVQSGVPTPTGTVGVIGTTVPSPTASVTPTPTSTATAVLPTSTRTPTATATGTGTGTATSTLTPAPTFTSTATATRTPTATATATSTATATRTPTATATVTATPTSTSVPSCIGPLTRELATIGSGTAAAYTESVSGGVAVRVEVTLTGAPATTAYDVYVDAGGGSAGNHHAVGELFTDASGAGSFSGSVTIPSIGSRIDVELVLTGGSASNHQYIRQEFTPCPELTPS